jgi:hypothetical protein
MSPGATSCHQEPCALAAFPFICFQMDRGKALFRLPIRIGVPATGLMRCRRAVPVPS